MTHPNDFVEADHPSYVGFLPHHSVDPEGDVVLLADNADAEPGTLGIAWRLGLVETEARTDADIGALAARIDAVLSNLPDGTIAQFILRSSRDLRGAVKSWESAEKTSDPVLAELGVCRVAALERLSLANAVSHFVVRRFQVLFTLVRPGKWQSESIGGLDALRSAAGADDGATRRVSEAYIKDRREIVDLAKTLESLFAQAGISAQRLNGEAMATELHQALNPLRSRTMSMPAQLDGQRLAERAALSPLDVDLDSGVVGLDELFHKIVSVTHLPGATRAGMLMRSLGATFLDTVPELDLVFNVHVGDQEEIRSAFGANRRMATDQSRDAHQSPTMQPQLGELVAIERELASGARVVSVRIHAIARAWSKDDAANHARSLQAAFQTAGFRSIIEDALAGTIFLQCLPLGYRPLLDRPMRRGRKALTMNLAHLVPLYGAFAGTPTPTQILLNRRGEPVTLSFFNAKEVPHAVVTGKSGAGKSVFANDLILCALRTGGRVTVLDRGGSYKKLTEIVGGAYVSYDAKRPPRLNPCGASGADGSCPEETNAFLRDWLTEMATHGKGDLSVRDQGLLSMAVRKAFSVKPGKEVFLSDIHAALALLSAEHAAAKDLAVCLSDYVKDGPYARFFDGPNEIDFANPFVAVDLADAALEDAVTSVLVMALMHRIADAARRWLSDDKYLIVDEAWTLLKSPATARFIENVSRTARKTRLSLVILSQQITDLAGATGAAILAQASYKVCLHQDAEAIRRAAELLGLNAREVELYGSLRTVAGIYSEFLVKTPFSSGVARLVIDPFSYWISTSDPADRKLLDTLMAKIEARGLSGREALRAALIEASVLAPPGGRGARWKVDPMDELTGFTAIDTIYELKGYRIAAEFQGMVGLLLASLLVGFGILRALYQASDDGRYRRLVVYIAQSVIILGFLSPVRVNVALPAGYVYENDEDELIGVAEGNANRQPSVTAPRILVWTHIGIDALTRSLTGAANAAFTKHPYGVERAAVRLRLTKINDSGLRDRYYAFVVYCYVPVLAARHRNGLPHPDRFYDAFSVGDRAEYDRYYAWNGDGVRLDAEGRPTTDGSKHATCAVIKDGLLADLRRHVNTDETHLETMEILKEGFLSRNRPDLANGSTLRDLTLRTVLFNETHGMFAASEIRALADGVPAYNVFATDQQSSSNPEDLVDTARTAISFVVKLKQSVDQWIGHHAEGAAGYYKVVCYAPYVYGLASMLLLVIFPIAGYIALLPGQWKAILTWAKYFLWVKLWLVFWSVLAGFNAWRSSIEDLGSDPSNGIGDASYIFPAIAAMYLVTPALSLIVVQLLSAAGGAVTNAFGGAISGGGGSVGGSVQWAESMAGKGVSMASGAASGGTMDVGVAVDAGNSAQGGEESGLGPTPEVPPVV